MENRQLKLVKNTKKKKIHKKMILLCVVLLLGLAISLILFLFSLKEIQIKGNHTYTEGEVIQAMKEQDYVPNTLIMTLQNRIFHQKYLPFIEDITMRPEDGHTLTVKIKEKLRAGVFEYMNKNVYFNSDGIAMESRNYRFPDVPVVTGVKFNKLVLGEKIPVEGDYFNTILSITKKIATYGLEISEIHFEHEDDVTLVSGKYEIYLGSTAYLDGKMAKIGEILSSVSKQHKEGTIDMHLYTDEKNIITFYKGKTR